MKLISPFTTFLIVSLAGCSSPPPVLTSQINLVNEQQSDFNLVPKKYWSILDTLKQSDKIEIEHRELFAESAYVSALGKKCIKLKISRLDTAETTKHVVCQSKQNEWEHIPPMVVLAPDMPFVEQL